ncbi:MAG: Npt1/Npt2 family nucleotide transporter, partial [Halioglobus sp.]
ISAAVLSSTVLCILWLTRWKNDDYLPNNIQIKEKTGEALSGSIWGGFVLIAKSRYLTGICLFIILYAVSITFVQIQQAQLIESAYTDPTERTKLFSQIDFAVNALTLIFQLFITSRLIGWIGYRATLMLIPVGITIGFGVMAASPMLAVMIGVEVFRRSGDYAIMKPTREMLFSVVNREEKYKAKNFIDTAVLRTGNTSSAWIFAGIKGLGAGAATITGISLLLGVAWCSVAFWLGGRFVKTSGKASSE